jgi:hypothetical protein
VNRADLPLRLLDGERIVWSGCPARGVLFTARDWFLIPFSIFWCGFAIFWEATVLRSKAPGFFAFWGVPFIVVGLYLTVGRFGFDAWLRRCTQYAVTNRRIVIVRTGAFPKLTSVGLDRLPDLQLTERPDGSGTIRFGPSQPIWGTAAWGAWSPSTDPTPQFIGIENAQQVFDRIQRAARGAA